jgi:AraC-like DNA-binding protein
MPGPPGMEAERSVQPRQTRHLSITSIDPFEALPRVVTVGEETARPGYFCQPQRRPRDLFAVVQMTVAGCGAVWPGWMAGERPRPLAVPPGSALVFITGRHDLAYGLAAGERGWSFAYAEFGGTAARELLSELVRRHGHVLVPGGDGFVREVRRMLDAPGERQVVWDGGESARVATALLTAALPRGVGDDLAQRAAAWLLARLDQPVGMAELAQALRVSREHLTRAFRAATGEAPATWLRRHRLEQAARLLLVPDAEVAAVAARVGFRSVSHFIKAFTAHYGTTPARSMRRPDSLQGDAPA